MLSDILTIARGQLTLARFIRQKLSFPDISPRDELASACASVTAVHSLLSFLWRTRHIVRIYYRRNQSRNLERILKRKRNYFPTCPWFYTCRDFWATRISFVAGVGTVHSVEQKSIGLKFSKSRTGSHVTYSCHHNLSRFTFPIFVYV